MDEWNERKSDRTTKTIHRIYNIFFAGMMSFTTLTCSGIEETGCLKTVYKCYYCQSDDIGSEIHTLGGRREASSCSRVLKCTIFFCKHSGNAKAFSVVLGMPTSDIGLIKNIIIYAFFFFWKNERSAQLSDCAAIIECYIRAKRFFNITCLSFVMYNNLHLIRKAYRKELAKVASSAK